MNESGHSLTQVTLTWAYDRVDGLISFKRQDMLGPTLAPRSIAEHQCQSLAFRFSTFHTQHVEESSIDDDDEDRSSKVIQSGKNGETFAFRHMSSKASRTATTRQARRRSLGDEKKFKNINFEYHRRATSSLTGPESSMSSHKADEYDHRWQGPLKRFLIVTRVFLFRTCHRIVQRIKKGVREEASLDSPASLSEEDHRSQNKNKIGPGILWLLGLIFCCPFAVPSLYLHKRSKRSRRAASEKRKRRDAFEEVYVRRHGHHSKSYLHHKICEWWAKQRDRRQFEVWLKVLGLVFSARDVFGFGSDEDGEEKVLSLEERV